MAFLAVSGLLLVGMLLPPRSTAVMPDPRPLLGSQPYATLLCRFSGVLPDNSGVLPVSYYDQLMTGGPGSLDDYWRQVSYGALDLAGSKAFGWFQMAKPASAYARPDLGRADLDALARDCTSAAASGDPSLDFGNYIGLNLVFSECVDRSRGGALALNLAGQTRKYRMTWLCPGYASSHQIVAHEMGHSFGLTHSEDNQGAEYGNHWDVMSNAGYCAPSTDLGLLAQQPIAYAKDLLGWIRAEDKYTARGPGVVTIQLDYLERQRSASPGFLMAQIPLPGGRFYTVEARDRSGYDAALPTEGVLIHQVDPARDNRARLVTGRASVGPSALLSSRGGWGPGAAFVDADNGIGISVDAQVEGGFVVTIYTDALPWPRDSGFQNVHASDGVLLQWQAVRGVRRYEVQLSQLVSAEPALPPEDGRRVKTSSWGATFVSDQPSLAARLNEGTYRWQVRALPDGPWSPPATVVVGKSPTWRAPQQIAQLDAPLRVAPVVNARDDGGVDVAWAQDGQQRTVAVTQAAWQGTEWVMQKLPTVPSVSRREPALTFTSAGDLKLAWPASAVEGMTAVSSPVVAIDAGGRAHAIWAGVASGSRGLFSAVVEAHAPSAGPAATPLPRVQPIPVSEDVTGSAKYSPALALDRDGNGQAVWIDTRDGHSAVYSAEQRADGAWGPSVRLSDPNEAVIGRPAIAVDAAGNAYAIWQGSVDCGGPTSLTELSFAERPAGGDWLPPITLAVPTGDAHLSDAALAVNDGGELYVAWAEAGGQGYRVYSAYRSPAGHWESPRLAVEGQTDGRAPTLSLAVNPQGDAYLTWVESHEGRSLVRFAATR